MSWRACCRAIAFTLVILFMWAVAYTVVEYQVAKAVSAQRKADATAELIERMLEAGRDANEIRAAVEALNRRYDATHNKGR